MLTLFARLFHLEQTSNREKVLSGVILLLIVMGAGYWGSMLEGQKKIFYDHLIKPEGTPPDWVFPIVWTALFFCIAGAGWFAWNHYASNLWRKVYMGLYLLNALLIWLWPHLFFAKQEMGMALMTILGIIIVIEVMMIIGFKVNNKSAYLLVPYLIWILFATYLNASFIVLNPM